MLVTNGNALEPLCARSLATRNPQTACAWCIKFPWLTEIIASVLSSFLRVPSTAMNSLGKWGHSIRATCLKVKVDVLA
jgi:hypothetical protein